MKANRAFELIFSRENLQPAFLADGEVVLYWELPAKEAVRLSRELRTDLAQLDAADFISKWEGEDIARE
jgi:hypothetical protein